MVPFRNQQLGHEVHYFIWIAKIQASLEGEDPLEVKSCSVPARRSFRARDLAMKRAGEPNRRYWLF